MMSADGTAPLANLSIMVVEDDFYQADSARRVFEAAGAQVVGPFGETRSALKVIETGALDCAVVDLNLGGGVSFDVVRALKQQRLPLVILSGYDRSVIPDDLREVARLEKPVETRLLIDTVRDAVRSRPVKTAPE